MDHGRPLGCDGDTISITAATQPSLEDVVMGAIPGLPKVHLHHPVLAYENGDDFLAPFHAAAAGKSARPFVLVVEGSIPNEKHQHRRVLGGHGHGPGDGAADHHLRVARQAGAARLGGRGDRHLRHLRRHPRDVGEPDRRDGPARLPRLGLQVDGGNPDRLRPRLPGATRQLHGDGAVPALSGVGHGAADPARRGAAPDVVVRQHGARGLRPRRVLRAGRFRDAVRHESVHRQAGVLGAGCPVQRRQARLDERHRRLPQRRRHLHRLHDARLPRQVHAVHGRAAGRQDVVGRGPHVRAHRPRAAQLHAELARQGAGVARARPFALDGLRARRITDDHCERRAKARRHELGSHHPHRREPGHPHEDRLLQPPGDRVPQHLVHIPRLQRVHERQGPARRALHHESNLRHLW